MGISVNVGFADLILWLILYGMGQAVWEDSVFYIPKGMKGGCGRS